MTQQENVRKFKSRLIKRKLPLDFIALEELNAGRKNLYQEGLIGQNPERYGGCGYGNISQRLEPYNSPVNERRFAITGSQTGNLPELTEKHYVVVVRYRPEKNRVVAIGLIEPSSESMTHAAVYACDDSIRFVAHTHSPEIWQYRNELRIPSTSEAVEYGTPEMAQEVQRLFMEEDLSRRGIFAMGGHIDGIVSFGKTIEEAVRIQLDKLAEVEDFLMRPGRERR